MPRDSARSSSSVSRVWATASSSVCRAALRVVGELVAGPAEVHGEPDQPLLRAVVDVALQPAQRDRLGRGGGALLLLQRDDPLSHLGHAGEQRVRQPGLEPGAAARHQREGEQGEQPDRGVQGDPRARAVAHPEELAQVLVVDAARDGPVVDDVERAAQGQHPPDHEQHERGQGHQQPDERVQQVEPRLRVPDRGEHPPPEPGARLRPAVDRAYPGPVQHRGEPEPLDVGQPSGGVQEAGEDRQAERGHQQPGAAVRSPPPRGRSRRSPAGGPRVRRWCRGRGGAGARGRGTRSGRGGQWCGGHGSRLWAYVPRRPIPHAGLFGVGFSLLQNVRLASPRR